MSANREEEKKQKKALHELLKGEVATWDESLHVGRDRQPDSDRLQDFVRHHRKDADTHVHDAAEKLDEEEKKPFHASDKVQKTEAA